VNITDLVARMKAKQYRPQPVKRVYIPKPNGDRGPRGFTSSCALLFLFRFPFRLSISPKNPALSYFCFSRLREEIETPHSFEKICSLPLSPSLTALCNAGLFQFSLILSLLYTYFNSRITIYIFLIMSVPDRRSKGKYKMNIE
jgi:hypothetical protein